jgi:tetratricopeptide (TPR) repeat protein
MSENNDAREKTAEPSADGGSAGDRLDGWKRIARYLNRDVRTLRRWELNEGLPVHRLMHDKQGTVYALRSEIDAWLAQRGAATRAPKATPKKTRVGKPGLRWAWLMVPLLAIGALMVWDWPSDKEPVAALGEWDWVLITEFDNRTGEEVLSGTVEYALHRELSNSQHVKVVPKERINDVLQLMTLPPGKGIDLETGREISLRDGEIRMLVTGRVEKLGNTYLISTELVNPTDGVMLASFSREASEQDRILSRIGELADEVRAALGESMASIEESETMLARVTTPSLEALRLFSDANQVMAGLERNKAKAILEEAVRIDPDFASAHHLLAYAFWDREDQARSNAHLQRAVELADQTSERERLFILSTYYGFLEDQDKQMETLHLLLRLYPDHFWASGNLSNIYENVGRFQDTLQYRRRVAELRPNMVRWYPVLDTVQLAAVIGDLETRDLYLGKLKPYSNQPGFEWLPPFLMLMPVHQSWIDGNYARAFDAVEELVANLDSQAMVADGWLFAHIRSIYLALGKLDRFRDLSALRTQPGWFEALVDLDSGIPDTLERYLETADAEYWDATLMAKAGQTEGARTVIDDPAAAERLFDQVSLSPWKRLLRGQIALSEGRLNDAVAELDETRFLNITHKWAYLYAMHTLALTYEELGELEKAIDTLEEARLQKPLTIFETAGTYMWQRNAVYLSQLYVQNGQPAAARKIEAELRDVLRLADPDHPFLAALEADAADTH